MNSRVARVALVFSMRPFLDLILRRSSAPSIELREAMRQYVLADRAARTTRAAWRNAATGADYTRAITPRLSAGRRQHGADSSRIVKPQLHHLRGAQYGARL